MPKAISPRKLIKALERHGFMLKRTHGSHYLFQHPATKRRALVLLHTKDVPKGTLHDILKHSGLSMKDIR